MSAVAQIHPRKPSIRATFSSLSIRNFRLFFIGQSISNTGNWLTNVALTLLVLHITDSGSAIGILAACQYGPMLIFSAWAGAVVDRRNKRRFLLLTQIVEMLQSCSLAVFSLLNHPPIAGLYGLAIIGGMALSFDNPLRRSFVTEMVPTNERPNAVVLYSMIINISRIIGPAIAGVLITTVGYTWAFALDASSYIAVLICLLLMREGELYRKARTSRAMVTVADGVRYIASVPALWIPYVMLALIGTLAYNFTVSFPLFVTRALNGSDRDYTILYSSFSVGAIICALFIASRSTVTLKNIIQGAIAVGATLLLLSISPNFALALPIAVLVGIGSILYSTATTTNFQMQARQEMHGRVLALQSAAMVGSSAIGGPLLGVAFDTFGPRIPIAFGGCVCLVMAGFGFSMARRHNASLTSVQLDEGESLPINEQALEQRYEGVAEHGYAGDRDRGGEDHRSVVEAPAEVHQVAKA